MHFRTIYRVYLKFRVRCQFVSRHDSHNIILPQVRILCQYGKCKVFGNDNNNQQKGTKIKTEK